MVIKWVYDKSLDFVAYVYVYVSIACIVTEVDLVDWPF